MNARYVYQWSRHAALLFALLIYAASNGQARLVLNGANIVIGPGAYLVIANPAANAITRNSGFIVSENENAMVKWNIGTTAATYTVPWGYNGNYLPLVFTTSGGVGAGHFLFSTYRTGWANSSQLPAGVSNFSRASGADNAAYAVDRFWRVDAQGYTNKPALSSLVFTYLDAEHTATGNTIVENALRAQRWNTTSNTWTDYDPAVTVNTTTNQVTISSVNAANFFTWWVLSYLAKRHWVAAAPGVWSNTANWSTTAGGTGGATVPTTLDDVFFDDIRDASCTLDGAANMAALTMAAGYAGTVTQGAHTLTVGSTATLSGGVFAGGTSRIQVADNFVVSGAAFTSTADTLDVKKNFTVTAGSFTHNNGTVKFSGTDAAAPQDVTSNAVLQFRHVRVTKTASNPGVRIQSSQDITGILSLGTNAVLDADGSSNTAVLTLLSTNDDPVQDAAVGILPSGAAVSGNVTVQRYMRVEGGNETRIYRYIASPLQNASVADIQAEIPITGSFTGYSVCPTCLTNQSMFSYNEAVVTDVNGSGTADFNDGYIDFPDVANSETLQPGRGYALFVRGNILSSTRWDVRGVITQGNATPVTFPVTYTSSGSPANDGWNLVGNPFPATIDWNAASGWTKTNVGASIYIYDNGADPSRFATWNGVTGTNGGSRYIAMGQGFWVKATAAPVLRASESVKSAGTTASFFRESAENDLLRVTLAGGNVTDEAVIHFRDDATAAFDDHADAFKLKNQSFDLSTLDENGQALAINSWSALHCNASIRVHTDKLKPGIFSLQFTNLDSFQGDASVYLVDRFTGDSVAVTHSFAYNFIVSDAASQRADRFMLYFFKTPRPLEIRETDGELSVDATGEVQWYFNDTPIEGAHGATLTPVESGKYRVEIMRDGCLYRGMKEVWIMGTEPGTGLITISPNPTKGKVMIRYNGHARVSSIHIVSPLGAAVATLQPAWSADGETTVFDFSGYAAGVYLVKIISASGVTHAKVVHE